MLLCDTRPMGEQPALCSNFYCSSDRFRIMFDTTNNMNVQSWEMAAQIHIHTATNRATLPCERAHGGVVYRNDFGFAGCSHDARDLSGPHIDFNENGDRHPSMADVPTAKCRCLFPLDSGQRALTAFPTLEELTRLLLLWMLWLCGKRDLNELLMSESKFPMAFNQRPRG